VTFQDAEAGARRAAAEAEAVRGQLRTDLAAQTAEVQERARALESEKRELAAQLEAASESAEALDDYKRRAQAALKKSHASVAELTREKVAVQAALDTERERADRLAREAESSLAEAAAMLQKQQLQQREEGERESASKEVLLAAKSAAEAEVSRLVEELKSVEALLQACREELAAAQQATTATSSAGGEGVSSTARGVQVQTESADSSSSSSGSSSGNSAPTANSGSTGPEAGGQRTEDPSDDSSIAGANRDAVSSNAVAAWRSPEEQEQQQHSPSPRSEVEKEVRPRFEPPSARGHRDNVFVQELYAQMEALRKSVELGEVELKDCQDELAVSEGDKRRLSNRVEELVAFLERTKEVSEPRLSPFLVLD
jgi:chromosome segregation ATPase